MTYQTVILKTKRTDLLGFTQENNFSLKLSTPKGSTVQNVLNNLNCHRRPNKQIINVYTQDGKIANNMVIQESSIFFVF